jgi:hypothetical protein
LLLQRSRLADVLEQNADSVHVIGALAQCPQLVGGSRRQQLDRVEARRDVVVSGKRLLRD